MPPPPTRTDNTEYHYHAYTYPNANAPWGLSLAQPDRCKQVFYSMIWDLAGLAEYGATIHVPNIAFTTVGGPTAEGRRTMQLSFGSSDPDAPTVFITGGIHSREWIATEFAYLLAEYLIRNYKAAPQNRYEQAIHDLIHSRRIRFIPMVNPDGNMETVFGPNGDDSRYWRRNRRVLPASGAAWVGQLVNGASPNAPFTNVGQDAAPPHDARYNVPNYDPAASIPPAAPVYLPRTMPNNVIGVDPNRNLDSLAWGYECQPQFPPPHPNGCPGSDAYFGPNRASEVESANVQLAMNAAANPMIAASIDYHAYGRFVLFPTEASWNGSVGADYQSLGAAVHSFIRAQGDQLPNYLLGTPLQLVRYNATGTVMDHASQQRSSRAFTIELDPSGQLGLAGFDLNPLLIRTVFEKNILSALVLLTAPPRILGDLGEAGMAVAIAMSQFQFIGWNVYGRGNRLPL
jgi:hypothetical protein